MRTAHLASLTVLLAGHALAFASEIDTPTEAFGFWGSGESLLWWFKPGRVPPLVTAGGDGKLGSPGTRALVKTLGFDDDVRYGGRFALGYHFETIPSFGVEANYFFLAARQSEVRVSSDGNPLLAQPFFNIVTGQPDAQLIAKAGLAEGSVTVGTQMSLRGAEANLSAGLTRADSFRLSSLGGFRFLRLEDEVISGERFLVAPSVSGFGGSRVTLQDEFRTTNSFYGGQVGLVAAVEFGPLTIDCLGKVALGLMEQVVDVIGATTARSPSGSTTVFQGGLYALRSNNGRHLRDELAVLPEVGLTVGLQVTSQLKLSAGYSFLWVSTVARAGVQIDPAVNASQFPIRSGDGPLEGPARPAFRFDGADFWAQGLNLGVALRY